MKKRLLSLLSIIFVVFLLVSCGDKNYKVQFDLNGGTSEVTVEAQTIKEGGLVTKPNDPLKEGYSFVGWTSTDGETLWDFLVDTVKENMTLTARWTLQELKITFETLGGLPVPEEQIVLYGEKVIEPEDSPFLEGNEFLGWYLGEQEYDFNLEVKEDLVLTAKYNLVYAVKFLLNNELEEEFTQFICDGNTASKPLDPAKKGYIFDGWYYSLAGNDVLWDFSDLVKEDMTLFAKWISAANYFDEDFSEITLSIVDGQVLLPNRGPVSNFKITWSSSNPAFITNRGVVNPPTKSYGNVLVTLTATINYLGDAYTRDYLLTVPSKNEVSVTSELEVDFFNLTNEYEVADANILAFFVDDGNLPYLDVESFLLLLDGLIYSDELEFVYDDMLLTISYEVTDEEENKTYYYETIIDFYEGTIFTEKMNFFSNYIKSTATDYSEGINYVDYYVEDGNAVTFNLKKYQVEMVVYETGDKVYYLMPYNFLSMIFTSETYYNFYYNGDNFYGFYAIPYANDKEDEYDTYATIKNSSLNNTKIPKDVALSSYHQTAFIFDYYYGLRYSENYGIKESFYEKLNPTINDYLSTTSNFNLALRRFILKTLDELHSSYHFPGFYNSSSLTYPLTIDDLGPNTRDWYEEGLWKVDAAINASHRGDRKGYKFLDEAKDTAVIYLDGFETASVDEEKTAETDSDAFMRETLEAIFSENPNVKNVGIDLSYNTGGNIGALLRVLGFITEEPIEMSYQDPLTGQKQTYFITLDQEAYENVNWFFITSPVTFSAANLMTAIVKNQNLGPIFGTTSGGGAASIAPFVLAEGTMISISSNSLLSVRVKNEDDTYTYFDVENGIEPDLYLAPKDTQTSSKILALIEQYFN